MEVCPLMSGPVPRHDRLGNVVEYELFRAPCLKETCAFWDWWTTVNTEGVQNYEGCPVMHLWHLRALSHEKEQDL